MSYGMSFASLLAAVLVLIPLPWHWRARNVPTLSIIAWLFIANVICGVNTIVWYHNVDIKLVVWCDITTKLDVGANIALPAACFCLCMHLERIASGRQVTTTFSDKRRRMWIDLAICVVVPMVYMALHYVVQGHLFDIVEDFGCRPEDYVSIPEFFLMWFTPILLCLGTFVFSGLAFIHFLRRRATFARHLANSSTALTPGRYFRLMTMALVEMFWALFIISCTLYFNYRDGLRPWISWANVHSNFSNINLFALIVIPPTLLQWTYFLWWTTPISGYLFFVFFAFGADAMKEYALFVAWFRRNVLHQKREAAFLPCPLHGPTNIRKRSVIPVILSNSQDSNLPSSLAEHKIRYPDSPGALSLTSTIPSYYEALVSCSALHEAPISPSSPTTSVITIPIPARLHDSSRPASRPYYAGTVQIV
ncbi:uncharacterized protein FIBRA_04360 [Fibroporia radiculosa]|uniref:Uncharacterized protein n=1 Tax=Fibroporia radiculosa TaxID=599839 RepID=J4GP50_9APHY|nr:uncharacterized protein FIBRA_04360 [Fibroporia radiculosa]CCM02275.1 predicted protein [Fibroporia radiculosa]